MAIRPVTPIERLHCYDQSKTLQAVTAFIGVFYADFGCDDGEYRSHFANFAGREKTNHFSQDLEKTIQMMQESSEYGCFLSGPQQMQNFCMKYPEARIHDSYVYAFRLDTEHYSYLIQLTLYPEKAAQEKSGWLASCTMYCYMRSVFEQHIEKAKKGIRFITPSYEEMFRIEDGDSILYTLKGKEPVQTQCRYIDDYHLELTVRQKLRKYHICEFAEFLEMKGCQKLIPLRSSLPELCFVHGENPNQVVLIQKGVDGYFLSKAITPEKVTANNALMGISKAQEAAMVAGSMFGWDKPVADPRNYDEHGALLSSCKEGGETV